MGSIMYQGASPKIMYQGVEYGASGGNGVIEVYELKTYDLAGYTVTMTHSSGTTITKSVTTSPQTLKFEIGNPGEWTISNSKNNVTKTVYINVRDDYYNDSFLYRWDLTNSLLDEKEGLAVTLNNCTRDENGVYLSSASSAIEVPVGIKRGMKLEVKFGNMDKKFGTDNGRLISAYGSYYDRGFIVHDGEYFSVYYSGWDTDSDLLYDTFSNAKLSILYPSQEGYHKIYKNDVLVYEPQKYIDISSNSGFQIGCKNGYAYYDAYVESITIIDTTV